MIANVSPSSLTFEDTHNTLKYADRAKQIKCTTKQNVSDVKSHVSEYKKMIGQLQKEVETLRTKLATQEAMNGSNATPFTFSDSSSSSSSTSSPSLPTIRERYTSLRDEIDEKGRALLSEMQQLLHIRHEQTHYILDYCRKAIAVDVLEYQKNQILSCGVSHPLRGKGGGVKSPIPVGRVRGKEVVRDAALKLVERGRGEWEGRRREVERLERGLGGMQEKIQGLCVLLLLLLLLFDCFILLSLLFLIIYFFEKISLYLSPLSSFQISAPKNTKPSSNNKSLTTTTNKKDTPNS